ncbi:MAG: glycoside hydrolase family 15 protein [Myxococcota bacterium]
MTARRLLTPLALAVLTLQSASAKAQVDRSFSRLVTGNGHAVVSFERESARIDTFMEHAYRFHEPREDREDLCFEADESRDLAYDSYFGLRVNGAGTWLGDVALDEANYERGTNIIRAVQHVGELRAESRFAMPFGIELPALVMTLTVTNEGDEAVELAPYALFNYRLGNASGGRDPSADGEGVAWDEARQTLYEYGPSQGTFAYAALSPIAHATASLGSAGAFETLRRGQDLDDNRSAENVSDVAPAMQGASETLAPGASREFSVVVLWALDEDAGPDVDAFRTWLGDDSPLEKMRAEWQSWHAQGIENGAETLGLDAELYDQSLVMLRMGQVREEGRGFGQILASLPPGLGFVDAQWNISWVRDMAYAVAGLIASGHAQEARDALEFQLAAPRGRHTLEVGRPYRISITRYFGNGEEESDCNADGPNIEFDGFGLFLWTLGLYVDATGDETLLTEYWSVIRDEIAEVLVSLVDPSGVIAADSSIWEVHWNGRQRRFTYTSLAAVRGLCDAAAMAERIGESESATRFADVAAGIGQALVTRHTDSRGALGQSAEDLLAGSGYLDAATVEAVNWGVIQPEGRIAQATRRALLENLTVATGNGLMRNDDGGWYDSQEWVFVDLRLLPTLPRGERRTQLDQWLLDQARANDLNVSELLTADEGNYAGSIPMVGFGAGAYLVSNQAPMAAACGAYADEGDAPPPPPADAGPGADMGVSFDAGTVDSGMRDGGSGSGSDDDDGGGGCAASSGGESSLLLFGLFMIFGLRRRSLR